MKREDWSIPALLMEAVGIILEAAYIVLQIFYGITYHIPVYSILFNLLVGILVYAGLTLLALFPERIHRLPEEFCTGEIRKLSIRMVRLVKLIFVVGLFVPCVCDVFGMHMPSAYNVAVMVLLLVAGAYYEIRIIRLLRGRGK